MVLVLCLISAIVVNCCALFWDKFNKFNSGTNQANMVQVCLNSQTSSFQSRCVFCSANTYSNTMSGCTGQTFLPSNMTQSQALCIINLCQTQVSGVGSNQVTGFTGHKWGRKKRDIKMNKNWDDSKYLTFETHVLSIDGRDL